MRPVAAFAFILALSSAAFGQSSTSPPKITFAAKPESIKPTERAARVGELVRLTSSSPKGRWEIAPETVGGDLEPGTDGRAYFSAEKQGRYLLINYVGESQAAWVVITVGGESPTPPGPKPPQPPPQPPAPKPVDTTAATIREAFAKDAGEARQKREDAAQLSALWEEGAKLCDDASIKTAGDLVERLRKASASLAKERLTGTRKAIGEATAKLFGSPTAELTAANRKSAKELFELFANTLEELSK